MNPRREAERRLDGRYAARVLEPSPPAVIDPPWFADDPVAGDASDGRPVVSPVAGHGMTWSELAGNDPELAAWCAERWLGAHRRLGPLPPELAATRRALHRLAEAVISPARRRATGKIGLRYTVGGFGTPFFGPDAQIRVRGTELIVQVGETEQRAPITTLADAARHVGAELLPDGLDGEDAPLPVTADAAAFIGEWHGFAASVLEELRAGADPGSDPTRVQLWPEHFDLAVEIGAQSASARAAYGMSPGDDAHPEPYAYVAPWAQGGQGRPVAGDGLRRGRARLRDARRRRRPAGRRARVLPDPGRRAAGVRRRRAAGVRRPRPAPGTPRSASPPGPGAPGRSPAARSGALASPRRGE